MGAEQSSNRGAADKAPRKTDYYELLGVDNHAGDDEIKKAYRKKALELHPDRNYGDVERATQRFAEVQAAYEVLSDPQERAWYDSHHDAILRGDDPTDAATATGPQQYHNVRLTTAAEIYALIGRFNKTVPLDDSPGSFFTVLRETFDRIADAEYAAAAAAADSSDPSSDPTPEYPSFGTARDGEKTARAFYGPAWQHFSTRLGFAWRDRWRLADAPDRRVRRLMEKENRKAREDAAREYSDAVRALVAFVRRRDPRHGGGGNAQSEAERQKVLREAAAAQAARSRAAHREKVRRDEAAGGGEEFVVPEWVVRGEGEGEVGGHDSEFATEEEEDSEVEHFECVVCGKIFKSEKQYETHEKSKKHIKAVQQLRRQMRKENANFDLDLDEDQDQNQDLDQDQDLGDGDGDDGPTLEEEPGVTGENPSPSPSPEGEDGDEENDYGNHEENETPSTDKVTTTAVPSDGEGDSEHDDDDDDYASREAVEARLATGGVKQTKANDDLTLAGQVADISLKDEGESEGEEANQATSQSQKKKGKAKAKREKKAARQAAEAVSGSHTCTGCNANFDSKTKLFKHLDESGHAALKTAGPAVSSKSGKKKKKR